MAEQRSLPSESASAQDLLLATKLRMPRPRNGWVPRPRLVQRLRAGTERELVLVCGPAGFGKSSLLADWVRSDRRAVAWLSLDGADNDPVRFWRDVSAALDGVRPGVAEQVGALVSAAPSTSFAAAVTVLVNELAAAPDDVALVVDDYHVIDASEVHRSLEFLLDHLPAPLHLVLASRSDPPLPLARFRARGQLTELRGDELRFTPGRRPSSCAWRSDTISRRRSSRLSASAPRAAWPGSSWRPCRCRDAPTSPASSRSSPGATGSCWTT